MSPLITKGTKFEVQIRDPMKHNQKTKSQQKAQEGHLEEGKTQRPTKVMKSGKAMQNGREDLRKAQNQKTQNSP
jgi:hypothetical protein